MTYLVGYENLKSNDFISKLHKKSLNFKNMFEIKR